MANFNEFMQSVREGDKTNAKENFDAEYLNKADESGLKAIHWASLNNQVEIVKWLLKNQCDIESYTENGWRAIHFAVLKNHREIIKLLVEHFCDLECKTNNNETPLDIVSGNCNREFIDKICPETIYKQIGLTMGLSCSLKCNHKFCLTSVSTTRFEKGLFLCNGAFGKIYRIQDSIFSRQFVLKINKRKKNEEYEEKPHEKKKDKSQFIEYNMNEYRKLINHQRIVKYYGGLFRRDKWLLIMEYMAGGSLENEIRKSNSLSPTIVAQRCKDIIEGIVFLHQNKIIHRNIKPAKVLLDKNSRCKLIMSSLSRFIHSNNTDQESNVLKTFCGTSYYMAPEIINDEPYTFSIDIWAIGATIVHMVTGQRPYHAMNTNAIIFKIGTTKKIEYMRPRGHPDELEKFITDMLNPVPAERPTAKGLLDYEFMKNAPDGKEMEVKPVDKPFEDSDKENRENCIDIIKSAIENKNIATEMGLKCNTKCDHVFCLSSVSASNFQKGDFVGRGYLGNVYKVKESQSIRMIAIKTFNIGTNAKMIQAAKNFQDKLNKYHNAMRHERLVQYYGAIRKSQKLYIFREYMEGGSIKNEILKNRGTITPIAENLVKKYAKQILEALKFLHETGIIHRDVKSGNIFLNGDGNVKLADFGFSEFSKILTSDKERTFYGTSVFMPPEVIKDEKIDSSVDIWSLGATIQEMLTGRLPRMEFCGNDLTCKFAVMNNPDGSNLEISNEWKSFIYQMVKDNPKERATAKTLLQSEFINS